MRNWISGNELVTTLGMEPFELVDYVEKGLLKPYHPKTGLSIRTKTEDQCWLAFYKNELEFIVKQYPEEEIPERIKHHGRTNRLERTFLWQGLTSEEKKQDIENKIEELENKGTILPTDWQDFNWAEKTFPLIRKDMYQSYNIDTTLERLLSAKYEYGEFLNIANERSPDKICSNFNKCKLDIIEGYKIPSPAPDYLNKEHHAHSAMLVLACKCWEELFANDKNIYSMDDLKNKVSSWLDIKCSSNTLSDHKKEFIYEVVRPDYSRKRGPKDSK